MDSASRFAPRSFLVRLGVGALVLDLAVLLMAAASLRQSLRNHQDRALATAQNLTQVLDRNMSDTFGKADRALLALKDEAERLQAEPKAGAADLESFLQRQLARTPELMALRATNAEGVVTHGAGAMARGPVSVADRTHFIRLRDMPDAGLVISRPLLGRLTGTWVIILARRLEGPGHRFAGVVTAVIGLEQFERVFSALDVGPHGSVALRDLEMGLIARYPAPVSAGTAVGEQTVSGAFRAFAQSGQMAGTYETRTPFDGVRRTFSIRRVSGQPFYILVGLARQDYLSGWWQEVYQECLEVALFIGLTLAATWLLRRAWLRQRAEHAHLERLLAEVKTLGGLLPICSHCKKVRDDKGYWNQIEAYLNEHTDAEFTHGICPDCAREVFPRSGRHQTM
jgi:hypothetical protein